MICWQFSPMRQLGVCPGNRNNPKLTHGAGRRYAARVKTSYSRGPENAPSDNVMFPFRKILFPVDYSPPCEAVVPYVKDMLHRFSADLTLVHAYGAEALAYSQL